MDHKDIQAGCFGHLLARKARSKLPNSAGHAQRQTASKDHAHQDLSSANVAETSGEIKYYSPCCDFSFGLDAKRWLEGERLPSYTATAPPTSANDKNVASIVERSLDKEDRRLRELSLKIHDHPELMFDEKYAHGILTGYMEQCGFKVSRHYLGLDTAWRAEYTQGKGGRVIGINSEMDALAGMGHACGHNLIAVSGVGVALALKAALQAQPNVSAKIVLLGTPAEEGGGGKVILLERGAYKEMDACVMCHPSTGPPHSANLGSTIAMQGITVEYFGHSAHAGGAPWEGTNALDAAFMAYSGISLLRQQMKPDHRVHGVLEGKNWLPNVIPDYAKMRWLVRAPSSSELVPFVKRVQNCLEAAALATGCKINATLENAYFDLQQNPVLAQGFADVVGSRYGLTTRTIPVTASTDFGNVSYALPALHPSFADHTFHPSYFPLCYVLSKAIPTVPNGGNHTPAFATAARSEAAHAATITVTKGLALTAYRVLTDDGFFSKVKTSFEQSMALAPAMI